MRSIRKRRAVTVTGKPPISWHREDDKPAERIGLGVKHPRLAHAAPKGTYDLSQLCLLKAKSLRYDGPSDVLKPRKRSSVAVSGDDCDTTATESLDICHIFRWKLVKGRSEDLLSELGVDDATDSN